MMPITRFFEDFGSGETHGEHGPSSSTETYNATFDKPLGRCGSRAGCAADQENDFEIYSNDAQERVRFGGGHRAGRRVRNQLHALVAAGIGIMNIMLVV